MSDDTDLDIVRRAYAKHIMANFGVVDRRVEAAFASVKREHYLGRGPWQVICAGLCWDGRSSALSKVSALASSPMRTTS
jgi:protein-L-isoaspartate O-methyltransferase